MSDPARPVTTEGVLAKMRGDRGFMLPEWEFGARLDPVFFEAYSHLAPVTFGEGKALPARVRELIHIALLAFRGVSNRALLVHMRRALQHGATKQEILEALETALVAGGAPTLYNGLNALMELEEAPTTQTAA